MAWVFICIAAGAAGFLVFIIVDYVRVTAELRPKVDLAKREIKAGQTRIEQEKALTKQAKKATEVLQKEVEKLEKDVSVLVRQVEEFQEKERRRKPTKFRLDT